MAYSFAELGMTREVILQGIDALGTQSFPTNSWSGKVYIVDPRDNRLWDLKIVLRAAADGAGIKLPGVHK